MGFSRLLPIVLASLFVVPSLSVTLTQSNQLKTKTYDYVIVGAGTAGLVIASRLTENPNINVLVLEAGVTDAGDFVTQPPFIAPTITPNTPIDWNYTIVPQPGLNGRSFSYPRGRILGGSSSVNYLFHQYGSSEDWDRLGAVSGDSEWSWSNMRQYVQKHERLVPPVDGHNTTQQFIPEIHGFNGMVPVSLPGNNQTIDPRVIATTQQLSSQFPFNQDMGGGDHSLLGIGWLQSSAGGGVRSSSSTTYLAAANSRPNLTVMINAVVIKLIQAGPAPPGMTSFRSVEFQASPGTAASPAAALPVIVTAKREVILSAGAVNSPQILMLSGIGNSKDLQALNIKTIINNPSVGANLSDHTLLPNIFTVQPQHENETFDHILRDSSLLGGQVTDWISNKTGMLVNNVANNFGFFRVAPTNPIFKTTPDPAAGPGSPHWEMIFSNLFFSPGFSTPATGGYLTVVTVLISPTSRGSIKLKSSNPFDAPLINPNFLATPFDVAAMRDSVKSTLTFVGSSAFSDYISGRYGAAFQAATTDAGIDAYVRSLTTTIFHPFGSAAISPANAGYGVVNPDLTVKGTVGLRIVDASVLPYVPSSHTQGPVYLLAERASDIIKAAQTN